MAKKKMRKFKTGATRNVDFNKNDYEGFLQEGVCNGTCYVCGKPIENFKLKEEE